MAMDTRTVIRTVRHGNSCARSPLSTLFASTNNCGMPDFYHFFQFVISGIHFIVIVPQAELNLELFLSTDGPKEKHSDGEEEEEEKKASAKDQKMVKKDDGSTGEN